MINEIKLIKKEIITDRARMFTASSSSVGSIIANSYLRVAITPKIPIRDMKIDKTPKSSVVYNLDNIGEIARGIACAMVVPVKSVKTFRVNSDLKFSIILFSQSLITA
jgi:hypothetical protein